MRFTTSNLAANPNGTAPNPTVPPSNTAGPPLNPTGAPINPSATPTTPSQTAPGQRRPYILSGLEVASTLPNQSPTRRYPNVNTIFADVRPDNPPPRQVSTSDHQQGQGSPDTTKGGPSLQRWLSGHKDEDPWTPEKSQG